MNETGQDKKRLFKPGTCLVYVSRPQVKNNQTIDRADPSTQNKLSRLYAQRLQRILEIKAETETPATSAKKLKIFLTQSRLQINNQKKKLSHKRRRRRKGFPENV